MVKYFFKTNLKKTSLVFWFIILGQNMLMVWLCLNFTVIQTFKKDLILGGNLETRLWPRASAIAERLWSPESVNDPEEGNHYFALILIFIIIFVYKVISRCI